MNTWVFQCFYFRNKLLIFKIKTLNELGEFKKFVINFFFPKKNREFLVMLRKLFIIFFILFYKFNIELKVLNCILILFIALCLQLSKNPFYTDDLNNLELLSLLASVFTLFFGLCYHLNESTGMKMILFLVVYVGNTIFMVFFAKKLIAINIEPLRKVLSICFRISFKKDVKLGKKDFF